MTAARDPQEVPSEAAPTSSELDGQALQLRSKGMSFAKIAAEIGLDRPTEAVNAFRRALLRVPARQREKLKREEAIRLDAWADRVGETSDGETKERKLHVIDVLRKKVLAP
jgi:Arc/MetJ family transcription regulator